MRLEGPLSDGRVRGSAPKKARCETPGSRLETGASREAVIDDQALILVISTASHGVRSSDASVSRMECKSLELKGGSKAQS